jgi:hypothetical protein
MATAKKKAPAKKTAPVKKAAPAKKAASKPRGSDSETEYFLKQRQAYVRVASGDVFGPYPLKSAAGKTALKSEITGAIGRTGSKIRSGISGARGNSGGAGGRGMRGFGGGGPLGRGK